MANKDYRKELNLVSPKKTVPRAVAIVVLIVVAAVLSFTVVQLVRESKQRHAPVPAAASAPVLTQ